MIASDRLDGRTMQGERDLAAAYADKRAAYFAGARRDFTARLPHNPGAAILEIGCGSGDTGRLVLAAGKAGRYVGIEVFEAAAAEARRHLTEVHVGDVERMPLAFPPGSFDALILSEVLEHLIEPGVLLRRLAPLVKPGGMVLASSPNVAHWRVIAELLRGRFELADHGVFDRTHMRWFTPKSFVTMFEAAGFAVDSIGPVTPFGSRTRLLSRLTGGRFDHLFMVQVAIAGHRR
jgi:2-polyprenyl-3-methyl-5-hydroxy-6-metoxy-1,4-benzoquinol methylase